MSKVLDSRDPPLFVVYDVSQRQHWPSGGDEDGNGSWGASESSETAVHASTSPEKCREAMNAYFTRAKVRDSRMTCWFDEGMLKSRTSGNYNGGGYMSAFHHYEIRPAPRIEDRKV